MSAPGRSVNKVSFRSLRPGADNPGADNYAILDELERFRGQDGKFKFKLQWEGVNDGPQIWKQSSNPTTSKHPIVGYEPVDDACGSAKRWGGLALGDPKNARIDGTPGNWWWYAIMAGKAFKGGIPACSGSASRTELYVWNETAAVPKALGDSPAPTAVDTAAVSERCESQFSAQRSSLPKSRNDGFQKKSWRSGCAFAEEAGDVDTCKKKCPGCCGSTCKSNSCSGGGCCEASRRICKKACESFFAANGSLAPE